MNEALSVDSRCPNCDNQFQVAGTRTELSCPFCGDVVVWRRCPKVDQVFPALQRWLTWTHPGCGITHPVADPATTVQAGSQQERYRAKISPILEPGEVILWVAAGMVDVRWLGAKTGRRTTIAATDRRLILRTEKFAGYTVHDYSYGLISAVDYKKGQATANMTVSADGAETFVRVIAADEIDGLVGEIRRRIAIAGSW